LHGELGHKLNKLLVHVAAFDHLSELEVALDTRQETAKLMEILLLAQPLLPAQHSHDGRQHSVQERLPRLLVGKQRPTHRGQLRQALHRLRRARRS
jgi:hypothetical protein